MARRRKTKPGRPGSASQDRSVRGSDQGRAGAAGGGSQVPARWLVGFFRHLSAQAFPVVIGAAVATPVVLWLSISLGIGSVPERSSQHRSTQKTETARTFYSLCEMSEQELAAVDIAEANLLCAAGLPGSDSLDVDACLKTLDRWAEHVRQETDRHLYRFQQNPSEYNNSEGYFRILMLISVLQEDGGVHYNLDRILTPDFSNALDLFIHGMIDCENGGTCSSMPVLYTAVSRRLGYPVHLVLAKGHVFLSLGWAERSVQH